MNVELHPETPTYESLFPSGVLPLDTRLSWQQRFLGNETFNEDETLPHTDSLSVAGQNRVTDIGPTSAVEFDTTGVVKQVRLAEGRVKVAHGPIDRLGMPAMTMMFRIEDSAQLVALTRDAEIAFDVANTAAGFTITRLQTVKDKPYDARGTVKQLRATEGKVKIAHDPIDRLGMPAMTMLFRIEDAETLAGLERGMQIEFDVVNTASGFEISRIRPVPESVADALCYRIGPFASAASAQAVGSQIRSQGIEMMLDAESAGSGAYWLNAARAEGRKTPDLGAVTDLEAGVDVVAGPCRGGDGS